MEQAEIDRLEREDAERERARMVPGCEWCDYEGGWIYHTHAPTRVEINQPYQCPMCDQEVESLLHQEAGTVLSAEYLLPHGAPGGGLCVGSFYEVRHMADGVEVKPWAAFGH